MENNWKPIHLAPKDGTRILVCHEKYYSPNTASWRTYHPNAKGKPAWRDGAGIKLDPTHWMKMPKSPIEEDKTDAYGGLGREADEPGFYDRDIF